MRVTVTPQRAKEWLESNAGNRDLSMKQVRRIARDIIANRFRYNGETIKLDTNGRLIDGQHRLSAVVMANVPVVMEVIEGVPVEAADTIDQGRARSASDVLVIRGIATGGANARTLAAATKMILNYLEGNNPSFGQTTPAITGFIEEFDEITDLCKVISAIKEFPPAPLLAVAYLGTADGRFVTRMSEFLEGVATGANLPDGDARLAFRTTINNVRRRLPSSRMLDPNYVFQVTLRAWNAYADGRNLTQVRYGKKQRYVTPDIIGGPRVNAGVAGLRHYIKENRTTGPTITVLPPLTAPTGAKPSTTGRRKTTGYNTEIQGAD